MAQPLDSSAIDGLIPKVSVGEQVMIEYVPFTVVACDRAGVTLDGRFSQGKFKRGQIVSFRRFFWKVTEHLHVRNHLRIVPWGPTRLGVRIEGNKVLINWPEGKHGIG